VTWHSYKADRVKTICVYSDKYFNLTRVTVVRAATRLFDNKLPKHVKSCPNVCRLMYQGAAKETANTVVIAHSLATIREYLPIPQAGVHHLKLF